MIRHTSFKHGWFYHYRHHLPKSEQLCTPYATLHDYLLSMHTACPHDYFSGGPRSSKLRFNLGIEPIEIDGHEIAQLAAVSHDNSHYKTAHSRVQVCMLENDATTLACEVPIWLMPHELNGFDGVFDSNLPLTGHIDALRIEENQIWIWDYKPKAHKEKYATTQTYFYAYMLSKRTGIPLENFRCGYFDEHKTYVFMPKAEYLKNLPQLVIP